MDNLDRAMRNMSENMSDDTEHTFKQLGKVVHRGLTFKFCEALFGPLVLQIRVPSVPDQDVSLVLRTYEGSQYTETTLDISRAVQDGLKYVKGAYVIPNEMLGMNRRTDGSYRHVPDRNWGQIKSWGTWSVDGATLSVKLADDGAVGFLLAGKTLPKVVFVMQGICVPRETDGKQFPLFVDVPKRIAYLVKVQEQAREAPRPHVTLSEPMSEREFRAFEELLRARRVPCGGELDL